MSEYGDRLAQSRLAILEYVQQRQDRPGMLRSAFNKVAQAAGFGHGAARDEHSPEAAYERAEEREEERATRMRMEAAERAESEPVGVAGPADTATRKARRADRLFSGRFAGLGDAGRAYWQHHPARLVVELATPTLSSYGQRHPVNFLLVAAAAGALVYLARPWRLISVTGLAMAALRSPQLSSALISAIYGSGPEDAPPPPPA
ncbi:hypothetical protein JI739_07290 [Ramlibacter sp. AW1]|uniref:Uncharacterized protein n=1 Tax=Ramlibacter aurantiacus TaxID=2801330 RepID=A0A936ZT58_9BURK|nr:hypothetical protein [Ramlibacter aurantiacus]MBL0420149.1 hypothetical protein [Ramlibacter aurantiacus]